MPDPPPDDPWASGPSKTPTPPQKNLPSLSSSKWMTKVADRLGIPADVRAGASRLVDDMVQQKKIDDFMKASAMTYKVGGVDVAGLQPFFRMTAGANPRNLGPDDLARLMVKDAGRGDDAFDKAAGQCAYGRGTPEQVRMVTQALIDKGKLSDIRSKYEAMAPADFKATHGNVSNRPLSTENAIKLMQFEYGVGIDCAGYVQQAFVATHGGDRSAYDLRAINQEDLYHLKGNSNFAREATPVHARPGDLIILSPPPGDTAGHTVLVRDRHALDAGERGGLSGLGSFASTTDTVHRIQVDASWGAGHGNLDNGGVQRREFLYNENTGKWADLERGTVVPQAAGPYHGHPVEGVYHPRH